MGTLSLHLTSSLVTWAVHLLPEKCPGHSESVSPTQRYCPCWLDIDSRGDSRDTQVTWPVRHGDFRQTLWEEGPEERLGPVRMQEIAPPTCPCWQPCRASQHCQQPHQVPMAACCVHTQGSHAC